MDEIYNPEIIKLANTIKSTEKLAPSDFVCEAKSPVCGSYIKLGLKIDDEGIITDIGYEVEACLLTKAVLAIVLKNIVGKNIESALTAGEKLQRLLDEDKQVLEEDWSGWEELKLMQTAQDYTMRHDSIMLAFRALRKLSNNINNLA